MAARHPKQRRDSEIPVSAFSDIAFLLIIFFILTTTLSMLAGNKLDIPSTRESKKKSAVEQPTVTLSAEGITWGGSPKSITLDELRARLIEMDLQNKPSGKRIVVLNSAPKVPYQRYFEVMMAINDAGGILGMVAEPGESAEED